VVVTTALEMDTMSKYWCFTVNNPKDNYEDLHGVKKWSYMIAGHEVGDEGTPHLQCFVVYETRTRFSTVKKQLPRAHIEQMYGTTTQAIEYCKKDGRWLDFGTPPPENTRSGGRSGGVATADKYKKIIKLSEEHNFEEIKEEFAPQYFLHYNTIKRIAMDKRMKPKALKRHENEWIYGKTGLGKSSYVRETYPNLYDKTHNKWWNGYEGEEVVLIDDLGKTEATWIGTHLKIWADLYPFPCDQKWGENLIRPKKIIVTSNYSIEELFGHDENLCEALTRRFACRHIINPFPHLLRYQYDLESGSESETI
jgi:hypothetical protein